MIKRYSTRNKVTCSDGKKVSKSTANDRKKKAVEQYKQERHINGDGFCEDCGTNQAHLSVSHIVRVRECEYAQKAEQGWNPENFELLCPKCHTRWENWRRINLKDFAEIGNKDKKRDYLGKWWKDLHRIFMIREKDNN